MSGETCIPCVSECDGNGSLPCWRCGGSPWECGCDGIACGGDGEACDSAIACQECKGDGELPCPGSTHDDYDYEDNDDHELN